MTIASLLLVEDDLVDFISMTRAFRTSRLGLRIVWAQDGVEALETLRGAGQEPLKRPYVVLLDLNMPRMNGLEFLAELRADPKLRDTVVFVLTTSAEQSDRVAAYNQWVAGYLRKTSDADLRDIIRLLEDYCEVVELPTAAPGRRSGKQ